VASTTTSRRPLLASQATNRAMPRVAAEEGALILRQQLDSSQRSLMSTPAKLSTCPRLLLMTILVCGLAAPATVRLEWRRGRVPS
jgi:hypothetical protein